MFVSWALRSFRDSLIQVDPLAAAISHKAQKKPLPSVSKTPLLLQFTPFGAATLETLFGHQLLIEHLPNYLKLAIIDFF
ncbi:unnamed protein product, partial [Mesorhabditis spiculigera]